MVYVCSVWEGSGSFLLCLQATVIAIRAWAGNFQTTAMFLCNIFLVSLVTAVCTQRTQLLTYIIATTWYVCSVMDHDHVNWLWLKKTPDVNHLYTQVSIHTHIHKLTLIHTRSPTQAHYMVVKPLFHDERWPGSSLSHRGTSFMHPMALYWFLILLLQRKSFVKKTQTLIFWSRCRVLSACMLKKAKGS